MQVFEIHFNTKKGEALYDTFSYEPQKPYEKKLGSIYVAGNLLNLLPQNHQLLNKVAEILNQEHYSKSQRDPEEAFKDALNKVNDFLSQEVQKGNVSWMGNLNLAILNIQNLVLSFAKTGNIKIYLIRDQEFIDIGTNLEFQDIEPYPLKVFSNIAQGKLAIGDKILVVTNELFNFLQEEELLDNLSLIYDKSSLKRFLKDHKERLSATKGLCLLMIIDQKEALPSHIFSIKGVPLPKLPLWKFPTISLPQFSISKKVVLLASLIVILLSGFILFGLKSSQESQNIEKVLETAKLKTAQAEGFLILKEKKRAESLLKEALSLVEPLSSEDATLSKRIEDIKGLILNNLSRLEKTE